MGILRRHHRRSILERPFPDDWEAIILKDVAYDRLLDDEERRHLRSLVAILLDEKHWEGCGGLDLTDRHRVVTAAQAAIPLLACEPADCYHNVRSVLIYPGAYVQQQERVGSDGLVHTGSANLGEAWYNGPVVLSWADTLEASHTPGRGQNVVFHEFAHAVDMMTGMTNGTPPLRHRDHLQPWHTTMTTAFTQLQATYARGGRDVIRPYALTNVAEFFAVTTECFFDAPGPLKAAHGEVYDAFARFWGQDPAARFERSTHRT